MKDNGHIPVMKGEILEFLAPFYPGRFLDMTFGGGGHTSAILAGHAGNTVVAVDCDPEAAPRALALARENPGRFEFIDGFFDEVGLKEDSFNGIIFDLGVSSFQLDEPGRGFSFKAEADADMRMNPRVGVPAWKLLAKADRAELEKIIREFGEEPRWRAVVAAVEKARATRKIQTTLELSELITNHAKKGGKLHPATRVFMGLRMAVNDEIGRLERALPKTFTALAKNGILAVISFHSIEDRVVKTFFQGLTRPRDSAPARLLVKKVARPGDEELSGNPRSRSAKLRVLQKISKN